MPSTRCIFFYYSHACLEKKGYSFSEGMPPKWKLDNTHVYLMLHFHVPVFDTHFCIVEIIAKKLGPFAEEIKVIIQELIILKRVKNICTHCPMNFIHKEKLFSCMCTLQLTFISSWLEPQSWDSTFSLDFFQYFHCFFFYF